MMDDSKDSHYRSRLAFIVCWWKYSCGGAQGNHRLQELLKPYLDVFLDGGLDGIHIEPKIDSFHKIVRQC